MIATHEVGALLLALGRAGVELAPHPSDHARVRHRPAALSPTVAERLRSHRGAIVGLLAGVGLPEPGTDAADLLAERLGTADELGMATAPGTSGWMLALGESLGGVPEAVACDTPTPPEPVPSAVDLVEQRAAELAEDHYRDRAAERHWGFYHWWQMGETERARRRAKIVREGLAQSEVLG
ncbi:MAG: hypothetical protein KF768_02285 [Phycisphaeraceae bacterium]|nr:hypothetical protein [Phycisphaeraceae bacterium]